MRVGSTVAAVGNQEIDPGRDVALTAARQVVDSAYTPAAIAETVGQMAAKKAGDSRNKDLLRHRLPLGLRSSLSYGLPSSGGSRQQQAALDAAPRRTGSCSPRMTRPPTSPTPRWSPADQAR